MALILVHRNPGVKLERKSEEHMASDDRNENGGNSDVPPVANPGVMRPPFVYLGAIVLGVLLHFASPVRLVPHSVSGPLGGSAVLAAVVLFLWAVRTLRAAGTPVPGNRPTTTIVRKGPFRYSRNPIYLAFSLLQFGLALWVNSLWLLVTLMPAVALMSFVVIPREEHYLESRFPSEYLPYKASVRRWL
ncbi:Isoprenylcysteine carboxyl methyltransferase [Burkholderia sp. H160]|nr:Isoprenylcysteine carboxyl methyltransferase [Burkholderia sp. H160]